MRAEAYKQGRAWDKSTYPVPTPTRKRFRWMATALRTLHRWNSKPLDRQPATIMVPALYNFMPAENVALGWLNEIDALVSIRQRMACATRITGWDVFTFHTLHNADRYFDATIGVMRETWMKEGNLSPAAIREARFRFGKPFDYHRVHARLVENLVFQSSLLDWVGRHASDVPLRIHVIGTALLSALVSSGSISFSSAVESATRFGSRWDDSLRGMVNAKTDEDIGWAEFRLVRRLIEGHNRLSMGVSRDDLPVPDAPIRPFWYSATATAEPMLITTAQEAVSALETLNIASWSYAPAKATLNIDEPIRGWLISSLHPMARLCRWSFSNYLLATPPSVTLFLDHIAAMGPMRILPQASDPLQNRLRLSRIKVTGP